MNASLISTLRAHLGRAVELGEQARLRAVSKPEGENWADWKENGRHLRAARELRGVIDYLELEAGTTCDARIRPFPPGVDVEIECEDTAGHDTDTHHGTLRDYAYPGSTTAITWHRLDRRNYHGTWPGPCNGPDTIAGCTLPAGHSGRCEP